MRPIAIFQHDPNQQPGFLLRFLNDSGIPSRLIHSDDAAALPRTARSFSGLVFLGSDNSVNDPLPWIERELRLVKDALCCDVPVLGHCFGGQLLARSLGATVQRNGFPSIGWSRLRATPAAKPWFGAAKEVLAFNWHYETFAIPRGAVRTLFGVHCLNKGFAFGRNLAFQSHLEVTEDIVRSWCRAHRDELASATGPAVQSEQEILKCLPERLLKVHTVARSVYGHWTAQMPRPSSTLYFGGPISDSSCSNAALRPQASN